MRTGRAIVALAVVLALPSSIALAQSTTPSGTQTTTSGTQTTTSTQSTTTSGSTQSAFDKLSPGGQKIALALCGAQAGGCPTGQSSTQSPSGSTQTTASSFKTQSLTLDQIAQMKQHRGWGEIFKDMQKSGQIPPDVKNLGQLVSGRYQTQSSGTTITTGSGKTQVVGGSGNSGNSGSQFGKGHVGDDSAGSSAGGAGSSAGSHSAASNHGGGRGK